MKKVLKLVLIMTLSLCMAVVFCSCGEVTPTETADKYLSALKAQDQETVKTVYAGETFDIFDGVGEDVISSGGAKEDKDFFEDMMKEKMLDFNYTISDEKIDGDKATVKVKITTYEFGEATMNAISSYFEKALPMAYDGASEKELEKLMNDLFEKELGKLTEKKYTQDVTLDLVKKDGSWRVAEIDDSGDFINAVSGGLIESIEELYKDME